MKNEKAQNVVEYILLAVAVILVFLILLNPQAGPVKQSVNGMLYSTVDKLHNMTQEIKITP